MDSSSSTQQIDHVVVLQHGLHGTPGVLSNFATVIAEKLGSTGYVHLANSNYGILLTHDGIDCGGKRLAEEIDSLRISLSLRKGTKLSIIGHSLGGLYARYAIGYLLERDLLQYWKPTQFISYVSPHLGARKSPATWAGLFSFVAIVYCKAVISRTGLQLILEDSDLGAPLLQQLADPDGFYFRGLKTFEKRVVYANIVNDFQVGFTSAAILSTNPLTKITLSEENYLKDHPHIIDNSTIPYMEKIQSNNWNTNTDQKKEDQQENQQLYQGDVKAPLLRLILSNLQSISWERYSTHFTSPIGHDLIVGRFDYSRDVILHTSSIFLV